ncbi:MAG: phosphatidate cytidylyltransferase, partial [Rhodospirillaceae bacterium]
TAAASAATARSPAKGPPMLWTRIASGVVLGPVFLLLIFHGHPAFHVMIAIITAIITWEFVRMDSQLGFGARRVLIAAGVLGAILIPFAAPYAMFIVALSMLGLLLKRGDPIYLAPSYAVLPAVALAYLWAAGGAHRLDRQIMAPWGSAIDGGAFTVLWVVIIVWATDIGAYAFGRMIGGPKLAPAISPGKTRSGGVGGLVCAVAFSALLLWLFKVHIKPSHVIVAFLISVISQAGDLFESALKRRYGIKDSGGLIPGHGGFMDRFDGLWAAAPIAAVFCVILGGGVQRW